MRRGSRASRPGPHLLMLVENETLPEDRRVWLECRALRDAGWRVSAICPTEPGLPLYEEVDGVAIHRFPDPATGTSPLGFASGYARAWLRTAVLAHRIWREDPFDVLQACNPPDTYFALARYFQLRGVKFLFDQHDLCPEVYATRFEQIRPAVRKALELLERWTHRTADHVITVNESCRELLLRRNGTPPDRLSVVRTGADLAHLKPGPPRPELRRGRSHLCTYLGVMGPQDGIDTVLHAAHDIVHVQGRRDVHFALLGMGECLNDLRDLSAQLDLEDFVTFTGRADNAMISAYLSTTDVALQPDPKTEFTELCSMIKTIEYMAFGAPVVTFDLRETRRTAADAAFYVTEEGPEPFAHAILRVMDDAQLRKSLSAVGRERSRGVLAWETQRTEYLRIVAELAGLPCAAEQIAAPREAGDAADRIELRSA